MSAICQNFVQNAWKKDLCSNCFKSKDEHNQSKQKAIAPVVSLTKSVESIIVKTDRKKTKRSVEFTPELSEVIGYGGEDWSSSDEDPLDGVSSDDDDDDVEAEIPDSDDDKELRRLTKANTDFNANSLQDTQEVKKSYAQLMLGKPQVDSEGRKQTLLVSVTPFGQETTAKKYTKPVSHIPIAKNKETLGEAKSNVILTSYSKNAEKEEKSLLDEITETLENNKNPIQIRKKTQKELILSKPDSNKENVKEMPDKPKSNIPERKNGITRTPVIKRDQEKPIVYQTSIAKIELMNNKNSKLNKDKPIQETQIKTVSTENIETSPDVSAEIPIDSKTDDIAINENDKITGLPPQFPKPYSVPQTREQAGEPDGRADPEIIEPPALPLTAPPTLETHTSFLHSAIKPCEKPKVPSKPATIIIRKPAPTVQNDQPILSTFVPERPKLEKQDSNGSDIYKVGNKRRAPKPPSPETVCVENDKKERISSYNFDNLPEPAPRRSLSLSTDSLSSMPEEKKKEKRGRFSLKRFLRMGSSKDLPKIPTEVSDEDLPQPKPRLIIVHPSELNGAKVEVVAKSPEINETYVPIGEVQRAKPPPPPRNYDDYAKPNLPHPPKSQEILNRQKEYGKFNVKKLETVYANIGEVRLAITPHKPQRTASMREREAQQQKRSIYENVGKDPNENVYDYITGARSSSPECDSNNSPKAKSTRLKNGLTNRSESNMDVSGEYFKYQNIPRSVSLTYCGSETESEIYAPYSFYGSESEVAEDDHDWAITGSKTHKLRSRKGRSIVHKNLEDNYGAVIVANHEALAQVLENIQQTVTVQPAVRGLKTASNLTWNDFSIKNPAQPTVVGHRAFHQAVWCNQHVTLVTSTGSVPTSTLSLGTFSLIPITEFSDLIPVKYLPVKYSSEVEHLQATVAILPWMQVNTIQSYGEFLASKGLQTEDDSKETYFILLQLVNALKSLQAQGIEELPSSLSSFVLCREVDKDTHYRLYILQGLGEDLTRKKDDSFRTLCVCASTALSLLRPTSKLSSLIQSLLINERAVSLTQMKSVLEFSLWGPSDVALGSTVRERELALQRWLDLQRATVLHGLVCTKVHLTVYEECHLLFLVRSNARMMCDASLLLESNNLQNHINGHK